MDVQLQTWEPFTEALTILIENSLGEIMSQVSNTFTHDLPYTHLDTQNICSDEDIIKASKLVGQYYRAYDIGIGIGYILFS